RPHGDAAWRGAHPDGPPRRVPGDGQSPVPAGGGGSARGRDRDDQGRRAGGPEGGRVPWPACRGGYARGADRRPVRTWIGGVRPVPRDDPGQGWTCGATAFGD